MKSSIMLSAAAVVFPALISAQSSTIASGGFARPLLVISYNMLNGGSGTWRYLDCNYNGAGDPLADISPLSGGTGFLTDGVGAVNSWDATANPRGSCQGQFVGWNTIEPTITFFFASAVSLSHVRVNYDISNTGGVAAPGPITINGTTYATTIPGGTEPFWADYDIDGGIPTTSSVTMFFPHTSEWIMISEVQFQATPEPTSLTLLATGLAGVLLAVRRRKGGAYRRAVT